MMDNALAHVGASNFKQPINAVHFSGLQQLIGSTAQAPRAKRLSHGKMLLIQVLDLEGNLL